MKLCPKFLRLKKRESALLRKKRKVEIQLDVVCEKLGCFKEMKEEVSHVQL
jgi:hypothetical protein